MKRKPFAKQFEKNANFQIKRLNDAIYRYGGTVSNIIPCLQASSLAQLGLRRKHISACLTNLSLKILISSSVISIIPDTIKSFIYNIN